MASTPSPGLRRRPLHHRRRQDRRRRGGARAGPGADRHGRKNWNNLKTVYTHGFGLVAAYGNRRQAGGEPEWIAKDIPPTGKIEEHEPRIYFGELQTDYSIVGAPAGQAPIELDTPGGGEAGNPKTSTYAGQGGVTIGSLWRRLLYAVKFGDVNILLSDRVNDASKIIYDRTPRERVTKAAPWLKVDADAYPAVVDGRIVWTWTATPRPTPTPTASAASSTG